MPEVRGDYRDLPPLKTVNEVTFYPIAGAGANPACTAMDGPNKWIVGHQGKYVAHGYLTLEFDGPTLRESYRDAEGRELEAIQLH
jgi:hypothetical protein